MAFNMQSGLPRDTSTGAIVATTNAVGAAMSSGFLRAPTGELVVVVVK